MRKFIISEDRLVDLLLTEDEFIAIDNVNGFKHAQYHRWLFENSSELEEAKEDFPEDADGLELIEDVLKGYKEYKGE
mgnify:CR=1 FL=1